MNSVRKSKRKHVNKQSNENATNDIPTASESIEVQSETINFLEDMNDAGLFRSGGEQKRVEERSKTGV